MMNQLNTKLTGDQTRARGDLHMKVFDEAVRLEFKTVDKRAYERSVMSLKIITALRYLGEKGEAVLEQVSPQRQLQFRSGTMKESLEGYLEGKLEMWKDAIPCIVHAVSVNEYHGAQIDKDFEAAVAKIPRIYLENCDIPAERRFFKVMELEERFKRCLVDKHLLMELIPMCSSSEAMRDLCQANLQHDQSASLEHLYQYFLIERSEEARKRSVPLSTFNEAVSTMLSTLEDRDIEIKCLGGDLVVKYNRGSSKQLEFQRPENQVWVAGNIEQLRTVFTEHPRVGPSAVYSTSNTTTVYLQCGGRFAYNYRQDYCEVKFVLYIDKPPWTMKNAPRYVDVGCRVVKPEAYWSSLLRKFYERPADRESLSYQISNMQRNIPEACSGENPQHFEFFSSQPKEIRDPLAVYELRINIAQELFEGTYDVKIAKWNIEVKKIHPTDVQILLSISPVPSDAPPQGQMIRFNVGKSGETAIRTDQWTSMFKSLEYHGFPLDHQARHVMENDQFVVIYTQTNVTRSVVDRARAVLAERVKVTAKTLPAAVTSDVGRESKQLEEPVVTQEHAETSEDFMITEEDNLTKET